MNMQLKLNAADGGTLRSVVVAQSVEKNCSSRWFLLWAPVDFLSVQLTCAAAATLTALCGWMNSIRCKQMGYLGWFPSSIRAVCCLYAAFTRERIKLVKRRKLVSNTSLNLNSCQLTLTKNTSAAVHQCFTVNWPQYGMLTCSSCTKLPIFE